jgi:hypothetical protein
MNTNMKGVVYWAFFWMSLVGLSACDTPIEPLADKGKAYSIYGPLNMLDTPNYIRVHDTNDLLNTNATRDLGAEVSFTNLNTGATQLLEDEFRIFDSLYTHNFEIPDSIKFDTRYKISLEDEDGFKDSLITVTPKRSQVSLSNTLVDCDEVFQIRFTNIDLEAGEELELETGLQLGNQWFWTQRNSTIEYDPETEILKAKWTPIGISAALFGELQGGTLVYPQCFEFDNTKIRIRYRHLGYIEDFGNSTVQDIQDQEGQTYFRKIVLSFYSEEKELFFKDTAKQPDSPPSN